MTEAILTRPETKEYFEYYGTYISKVPEGNVTDLLEKQFEATRRLLSGLKEDQANFRYAPDKWSVKEVIGHLSDSERVFAYRALRIARGDQTPLAGFDQEPYVLAANFDQRTMASILEEFASVRQSTLTLLRGLPAEASRRTGVANEKLVSVRALAYIIAGHELHHLTQLRERYRIG